MNAREPIIEKISQIDSLPTSVMDLIGLLQNQDVDITKVVDAIEYEPSIAANILKIANSVGYARRERIATIRQAIMRVGLRKIAELALDYAISGHANKPVAGYGMPPGALWEHSVATAIAVDLLVEHQKIDAPIEAFVAGLLHDIGKIVLGTFIDIDAEPILIADFDRKLSFEQAEREILGIDHAEVGAILLEQWGINPMICDAVRWHHDPEHAPEKSQLCTELVHVASMIITTSSIGGGNDGLQYHSDIQLFDKWDIKPVVIESVLRRAIDRLDEIRHLNHELTGKAAS